jgi:hypothetical protein
MFDKEALFSGVTEYETDAAGENIKIKLEMEPNDQSLFLTIPYHRIWSLMLAIRTAASLAVQRQQEVPQSQITAAAPFLADSVNVGTFPKTGRIALHLQTSEGIPLQIAMSRKMAESTISLLQSELDRSPDTLSRPS